jgi:hypothetical protein
MIITKSFKTRYLGEVILETTSEDSFAEQFLGEQPQILGE